LHSRQRFQSLCCVLDGHGIWPEELLLGFQAHHRAALLSLATDVVAERLASSDRAVERVAVDDVSEVGVGAQEVVHLHG
jgi:hypothetical protein